jgi:hypothetical protein
MDPVLILRISLMTTALTLFGALPALAQFSDNSGSVPAQGSACDPSSSQYDATQCAANPLGATSVGTIHIERSRPDLPQGEVPQSETPTIPPTGSDEP